MRTESLTTEAKNYFQETCKLLGADPDMVFEKLQGEVEDCSLDDAPQHFWLTLARQALIRYL